MQALLALAALALPFALAAPPPGALVVEADRTSLVAEPQDIATFRVNLTNLHSHAILASFDVRGADGARIDEGKAGSLLAPTPRPMQLKPGQRATVLLHASTPYENGRMDATDALVVRVLAAWPDEPGDTTEAATLRLTVHTRGVYVPGFAAPLSLAGMLVALALARTR